MGTTPGIRPLLVPLLLCSFPAGAFADDAREERSGAPYFLVQSEQPGVDRLPLKETTAKVDVAGVIAKVEVKQVYQNEGSRPIEAIYVFPGGSRAAVFGMRMTIGERTIVADIQKREDARRTYEQAKAAGKSASLLEQHRPNVFQMNVANIMPGDRIVVELSYTELLVPDAGVYELVYPTVVGPRYADGSSGTDESWTKNPYLAEGAAPPYRWDLRATIHAGMPIEAVTSPSHRISPRFSGADRVDVEVDDEKGGNRDFVLRYRLSGSAIQTGLLTYEGDDESYFLLMMQPPERPAANVIPPREYIFVVDVSGSMNGFPLDVTKNVMRNLLGGLKRDDRFNVLLFSGGNTVMAEKSVRATSGNVTRAMRILDSQRGGGGTQILPALKRALSMPRDPEMSTTIVVLTDGYVSVERKAFDLIRKNLNRANLFAFGIGTSVNRHLIEGMARSGMGEPFVVLNQGAGKEAAARFSRYVESPVLTNVGVHFDGFDAYDVEPSTIPDVFAERPVILFGKYRGAAEGRIVVEGHNGRGRFSTSLSVAESKPSEDAMALRYLWARHRIANLADVGRLRRDNSIVEEITALGLRHHLMTEYTSFVAVDSLVRNHQGAPTRVEQPLPAPDGVAMNRALAARPRPSLKRRPRGPPMRSFETSVSRAPAPASTPEPEPEAVDSDRADPPRTEVAEAEEERSAPPRLTVRGGTPAIRKLVLRQRHLLGRCLDRPAGTVKLRLEIGASGKIRGITILSSGGSARLDTCVSRVLRQLRFPATDRVELTLRFRR